MSQLLAVVTNRTTAGTPLPPSFRLLETDTDQRLLETDTDRRLLEASSDPVVAAAEDPPAEDPAPDDDCVTEPDPNG